jgi:cysteine desulfurase
MPVYLDHNATTPLDAAVLDTMMPFLREQFGNPSSPHRFGRRTRAAIDAAREQVAALVKVHASQVIFTSGGTESNNLAIKGVAAADEPGILAIGATEHPSVIEPARALAVHGWRVKEITVDREGRVHPELFRETIAARPRLVSLMYANNETGVIQDVPTLASAARSQGVVFHTDAVQAAGKLALDFPSSGVHLMSLSAHKINGPQGVGALVVDKAIECRPLLHGGGQERDRRSGTENVAGIVGFGAAASLAIDQMGVRTAHFMELRTRLESALRAIGGVAIFGAGANRLPNTVYFGLRDIDGETLILGLDRKGFACASGSACGSVRHEPSHVLRAMQVESDLAIGAIRVSFGAGNNERDVDDFAAALAMEIQRLRPPSRRRAV